MKISLVLGTNLLNTGVSAGPGTPLPTGWSPAGRPSDIAAAVVVVVVVHLFYAATVRWPLLVALGTTSATRQQFNATLHQIGARGEQRRFSVK